MVPKVFYRWDTRLRERVVENAGLQATPLKLLASLVFPSVKWENDASHRGPGPWPGGGGGRCEPQTVTSGEVTPRGLLGPGTLPASSRAADWELVQRPEPGDRKATGRRQEGAGPRVASEASCGRGAPRPSCGLA